MKERFPSPLIDQEFLKSSLLPMSIEERRRFEQNLIKYGLIDERDNVAQVAIASPLVVEPYGTLTTQTGEIRLKELAVGGDNYVGFRSPDEVLTNQVWTLPSQDGDYGQFLQTLGNDRLQWGWPYWIKTGNDIYFLNHVAIGATPSATYDLYVSGTSAFVAPDTATSAAIFTGDVDSPESIVKITNTSDGTASYCLELNRPLGQESGESGLIRATYDDLAHGMTTLTTTDTSFVIAHWTDATGAGTGDQGGISLAAFSEGELAIGFEANYTSGNTDYTSAFAPIVIEVYKKSGTTAGVAGTGEKLISIASSNARTDPTPLFHFVYGPSLMLVGAGSRIFLNDTVDTNMTVGLCLNQGTADDTILSLKSSDVSHGVTGLNETDTYGAFLKSTAASGGLKIRGFSEATDSLLLMGIYTTDDTTKSTSGRAAIEVWGQKKTAATTTDPGANANIFGIFKNTAPAALWLCDVEGDTWQAGAITATQATLNIATGTAPLVITSTTLCTNLNADLWDGYHAFQGDTLEPNGFEDRADSTLTWDDGTRTLTITGTDFVVWYKGVRYLLSTDTSQIADTSAFYWFYYEISGNTLNLTNSTSFPGFDAPLVATCYWNTTAGMDKGLVADERHGIVMDAATHEWAHETIGVRYESGLAGTFADATFSVALGELHDEDLDFSITPAQTTCDVLYMDGSSTWKWLANQTVYYYTSGGSLYYNNGTTLTAATVNRYVAAWIFATTSFVKPIVAIIGQRQDTTLADARLNNTYAGLSLGTLPFKEMKILYRVILQNDATPYIETQDLRSVSNISSGTYVASAHNTLSGLTTGDDHTQYAYVKIHATDAPTVNDDIDTYREGTIWIEQDANVVWLCADNADGAAVWHAIGQDLRTTDQVTFAAITGSDATADAVLTATALTGGYVGTTTAHKFYFISQNQQRMTVETTGVVWVADGGNFGLGLSAVGTNGTNTLIVKTGTAPTSDPADSFQMYSKDIVAGQAAPHFTLETGEEISLRDDGYYVDGVKMGGGAGAFLDLTDVDEADYTGHAAEFVVVNGTEDGLVFSASSVAGHDLTSATHTDVDNTGLSDDDILRYDSASGTWKCEALPAAANHDILSATHADTVASAVTRGSIIYGDSTPKWAELAIGTSGYVLVSDGTDISWGVVPSHSLLSASHGDTTAAGVSRGSIIIGDSTPKWIELTIGTANYVLKSDGTDCAWGSIAHALLSTTFHNDVAAQTVSRGSIIYGNSTPKWDELTIGTSGYVLASDGTDIAWSLIPTHASRHQSGGADAIKLDDFATPDDNTDLNASTSAHGLLAKLRNNFDFAQIISGAVAWRLPWEGRKPVMYAYVDATASYYWGQTLSFSGTSIGYGSDANGHWRAYRTAASGSTSSSIFFSASNAFYSNMLPAYHCRYQLGYTGYTDITDGHWHVGIFSAVQAEQAALSGEGACFNFSPTASGNWIARSRDATTEETTDTGIAAAAGTCIDFAIIFTATNTIKFYMDGALVATHIVRYPQTTTGLLVSQKAWTSEAVSKSHAVSHMMLIVNG